MDIELIRSTLLSFDVPIDRIEFFPKGSPWDDYIDYRENPKLGDERCVVDGYEILVRPFVPVSVSSGWQYSELNSVYVAYIWEI